MVILNIFKRNISVTYKTTFFSRATFLILTFGIICVVVPFVFAYKTKGFWIKRDIFYEQPNIKFKGEYIFLATTNTASNFLITCSTIPQYEEKFKHLDLCSVVKVREVDTNFDRKIDELIFNLKVNLAIKSQLNSFSIIIPLDYKLSGCPFQMQSAVIFQSFLPIPISQFFIASDVRITQTSPLVCHQKTANTAYNYSFIEHSKEINDYEFHSISTKYLKRNISTIMTNIYTHFVPEKSQTFNLIINLRYPEDKIYYKPGFWQIIKWAWIQYLSIYFIVAWIVHKIQTYIFNKRLVLFYEDNPLKKKQ